MVSLHMQGLIHWFTANVDVLAVLVALGVAVLLVCCVECTNCPRMDHDDLFHHHV